MSWYIPYLKSKRELSFGDECRNHSKNADIESNGCLGNNNDHSNLKRKHQELHSPDGSPSKIANTYTDDESNSGISDCSDNMN